MGFFSWNCTKCGHSIMNPYACKGEEWLNEAVVILPNGNMYHGVYDGYGRIGGIELTLDHTFEMMHKKCWEKAGKPIHFDVQSPNAGGQGHFYDDGAPPERTWRDAMAEGDPDFLSVASENARERERGGD